METVWRSAENLVRPVADFTLSDGGLDSLDISCSETGVTTIGLIEARNTTVNWTPPASLFSDKHSLGVPGIGPGHVVFIGSIIATLLEVKRAVNCCKYWWNLPKLWIVRVRRVTPDTGI
jgi:hypothetical protein